MDKNKIIQAATKYVQKGQFDKAIKEYQKIIDDDPKDIRILQKVGELHQKRGDNVQAALTFIKVAESYANDGFFLKAAAVYKQVLKLNPSLVETNFKLAELYQQLGLMSDAFQQFQLVAAAYEQQGDVQASLGILKKLTELDPENVANRIRLAESYSREGMTEESVAEFTKVAAVLKQNNRADEYIKVAERLAFLDPQNMTLCRELANVYLAKGDTKRALAKLQICFKTDPRDIETLTLLAQAFKDLGQTSKTISVYKELAKIFSEADRFDDEKAIWRKVLTLAPDDQDALDWQSANGLSAASAPAAAPAAAQPEPSKIRARPSGRSRDVGPEAVPKLLTEMDVYLKYGLHAKAAEHLKKILAVAPNNLVAHEKAKDLYLTMGDMRRAADALATAARLAVEAGERDRAHEHLLKLEEIDPQHPDLAALSESIGADVEVAELADDAILVEASDDEFLVAADEEVQEDERPAHTASDFEVPALEGDEGLVSADDGADEAAALLDPDTGEGLVQEPADELGMTAELDAPSESDVGPPLEEEALPFDTDPGHDVGGNAALVAPMLEMDSAGEGDFDDAATQAFDRDALLKEAFGGKAPPSMAQMARAPLASPRRALVPPPPAVVPEYIPQEIPEVEEESLEREVAYEAPEEAAPEEPAAPEEAPEEADPEELAEAEFFIEQQLWDEAGEVIGNLRSRIQHYPHLHERLVSLERRLAAARDEGEDTHADAPAGEADGQFDLGAELEKEVDAAPAPEATDDFQYSVEDVLREFKKGVERTVRPEDIETHYDLGIAYREMGLLDEAIGEFDMAAKGATGKPREADCLATIGECLKGKGDLAGAAVVFEKASQIGGVRPETRLNLFFEIGVVREELEDLLAAITAYEKVVALDPKYRDVAERLARLRKKKPPPGSNGAGGAARKVGYL